MNEQWQELKETIVELRDNDGTGTQQEVCKFLVNYMGILEKQMQESSGDVPDINDGNIYECSCGYGWDKSKVVRHHFCPNCGKAVEPSYNSIKTEKKPCGDAVSRQAVLDIVDSYSESKSNVEDVTQDIISDIVALPPVNPQAKAGHWIDDKCSVCGKGIEDLIDSREWYRNEEPNFCPFCGLKLVNSQESEG